MAEQKYKRILLKVSGKSLAGDQGLGISHAMLDHVSEEIKTVKELGVDVGIVIGGGNIFRGARQSLPFIDRVSADHMGMLATIINAIALQNYLEKKGMFTRIMSAITVEAMAEPFIRRRAVRHLDKGRIVIFAAGTGNPYFTTDTAASLRAIEVEADVILKGTRVDGVYSSDPEIDKDAYKYIELTYMEMVKKGLKIMDSTAVTLCMDNKLPIIIFNMLVQKNLLKIIEGENVGTIVR